MFSLSADQKFLAKTCRKIPVRMPAAAENAPAETFQGEIFVPAASATP